MWLGCMWRGNVCEKASWQSYLPLPPRLPKSHEFDDRLLCYRMRIGGRLCGRGRDNRWNFVEDGKTCSKRHQLPSFGLASSYRVYNLRLCEIGQGLCTAIDCKALHNLSHRLLRPLKRWTSSPTTQCSIIVYYVRSAFRFWVEVWSHISLLRTQRFPFSGWSLISY